MYKPLAKAAFIALVLSVSASAWSEERIAKTELPAPVQKTIDENSANASVQGYFKEKLGILTYYGVVFTASGHEKKLLIARDGRLFEIFTEVASEAVPAAVHTGLQNHAKKATLQKIYSVTRDEKLIGYDAVADKGGKSIHVQVDPAGKEINLSE